MALLLFGGPLAVMHEAGQLLVGGWLRIRAAAQASGWRGGLGAGGWGGGSFVRCVHRRRRGLLEACLTLPAAAVSVSPTN